MVAFQILDSESPLHTADNPALAAALLRQIVVVATSPTGEKRGVEKVAYQTGRQAKTEEAVALGPFI